MEFNFRGKKALVTGGGSGLGRECAILFAKNGADVLVADLIPEIPEKLLYLDIDMMAGGDI